MIRMLYIGLLIMYFISLVGCIYRAPIANRILGVSSEIIENGTSDFKEHKKVEQSFKLRKLITLSFIVASVLLCLCSFIVWYFELFLPSLIPKVVLIISGLIALTFIIANGVGFVPNPPIR